MMDGSTAEPLLSKETFYSNLNGTTKAEISLILTINPASVLLRSSLHIAVVAFGFKEGLAIQFLLDFLTLNLPLCLSVTLLSDAAFQILITQVILSLSLLFSAARFKGLRCKPTSTHAILPTPMGGRLPSITNFRVLSNIGVALGILAVDFPVFPRRFAKTETFGTGIMDGGVGAYILMNAIVSPEARGRQESVGVKSVLKSLKSSIPLLILGFGRLASVKGIDYHEHISEYGIHWNFFFTLAATKVLCTLLLCFIPACWSGLASLSLALLYQHLLTCHGLQKLVLHGSDMKDSREGFLNANREGLASCLGYVTIYFAGVRLGQHILRPRGCVHDWLRVLATLLAADGALWLVLAQVERHVGPPSRRLANLPYIIWNLAYSIHILCVYLGIDILLTIIRYHVLPKVDGKVTDDSSAISLLVSAIGRNQLLYFLLANLLTGLVNLSMDTIHQSDVVAFSIVTAYLLFLNVIFVTLHRNNIDSKLW